jgi:hypothetical protein
MRLTWIGNEAQFYLGVAFDIFEQSSKLVCIRFTLSGIDTPG